MKRLIKHIRRWNIWRKYNGNSRMHKLLVLIGLIHSPTMRMVLLPEELEQRDIHMDVCEAFLKGVNDALEQRAHYELTKKLSYVKEKDND